MLISFRGLVKRNCENRLGSRPPLCGALAWSRPRPRGGEGAVRRGIKRRGHEPRLRGSSAPGCGQRRRRLLLPLGHHNWFNTAASAPRPRPPPPRRRPQVVARFDSNTPCKPSGASGQPAAAAVPTEAVRPFYLLPLSSNIFFAPTRKFRMHNLIHTQFWRLYFLHVLCLR